MDVEIVGSMGKTVLAGLVLGLVVGFGLPVVSVSLPKYVEFLRSASLSLQPGDLGLDFCHECCLSEGSSRVSMTH